MPFYQKGVFLYKGNHDKNVTSKKLAQTLPAIGQAVKELKVIQTETINEVKEVCKAAAVEADILFIMGGDGTVHECVNSIAELEKRPVISILPGGTSNDFSRMLNIPQNLQAAAEAITDGEIIDVDLGKSNDRYFLNFWGIGLVSETSQNTNENFKKSFGILSYFLSTLQTINQVDPFSYEITADGKILEGEAVMIIVLNGKFLGTRELPIPTVSQTDGKLDVLVVKNSSLASFRELLSMNNPETIADELTELTHIQAEQVKVAADEKKEIDMDGEMKGETPGEITVLPGHLKMIKAIQ